MREKIRMNSTAGTGHFYTTDKNKRTMPDKLEMKKYDPVARKHVIYKEANNQDRKTKDKNSRNNVKKNDRKVEPIRHKRKRQK